MSGLDRKRKLSVITGALPPEIQRILKDTAPAVGPDGGPFQDDWEKGLARVAAEMMKVEDSEIVMSAMQKQGRSASKQDAPYQRHEFDEMKVKMGFLNKKFSLGAYGPVQKKGPQQSHGQPRGGQPFGRTRGRLMGTGGKKDHRRDFFSNIVKIVIMPATGMVATWGDQVCRRRRVREAPRMSRPWI